MYIYIYIYIYIYSFILPYYCFSFIPIPWINTFFGKLKQKKKDKNEQKKNLKIFNLSAVDYKHSKTALTKLFFLLAYL